MANVMIKRGALDNVVTYEHYCDTTADLKNIPSDQITLGSTAIVLENGTINAYIANSKKEWIAVISNDSSDSGTSPIADTAEVDEAILEE